MRNLEIPGEEISALIRLSGLTITEVAKSEGRVIDNFTRHLSRKAPIDPEEVDRIGRFLTDQLERRAQAALERRQAVARRLSELGRSVHTLEPGDEKALVG